MKRSAVSLIERADGRLLCVWNPHRGGWTLPGGKVEEGETVEAAQIRELWEETSLETLAAVQIYEGPHYSWLSDPPSDRITHVFRVHAYMGTARESEIGCPVSWFAREQFLRWGCFSSFYEGVFAAIDISKGASR